MLVFHEVADILQDLFLHWHSVVVADGILPKEIKLYHILFPIQLVMELCNRQRREDGKRRKGEMRRREREKMAKEGREKEGRREVRGREKMEGREVREEGRKGW